MKGKMPKTVKLFLVGLPIIGVVIASLMKPPTTALAWNCVTYTFSVSSSGIVTVDNGSSSNEGSEHANVYINGSLAKTFNVPALKAGDSAILGPVSVPSDGFIWEVKGDVDCGGHGTITAAAVKYPVIVPNMWGGANTTDHSVCALEAAPGLKNISVDLQKLKCFPKTNPNWTADVVCNGSVRDVNGKPVWACMGWAQSYMPLFGLQSADQLHKIWKDMRNGTPVDP